MSWEAVQWANKQRLRLPQEQLVLVLLANAADPEGVAFSWWKSKDHWMDYLVERSRMKRATVFRHLATIESLGLGKREKVARADGTSYKIMILDLSKSIVMKADDETLSPTGESLTSGSPAGETLTGETPRVSPVGLQEVHKEVLKDLEREARAGDALEKLKAISVTAVADDPTKVRDAWDLLPESERQPAIDGYPLWLAEFKSLGRKYVPSLEKYVDRRYWKGLKPAEKASQERPAKPVPKSYAPNVPEVRALTYLARMAHAPLLQLGSGKVVFAGEITPRILAFATEPPATKRVEIGSGQFRAWDDLFAQVFGGKRARLTVIDVPFDWPPRKDGSIIPSGSDPPGTLSDEDARALSGT